MTLPNVLHAEHAIALAAATSIAFSDVSQAAFALGFAAVGGIMGGWAGSIVIPAKNVREGSMRTLVNLCIALPGGPALGYQVSHCLPDVPLYSCIMASALALGMLGVTLFTILIPRIMGRFLKKDGSKNQDD